MQGHWRVYSSSEFDLTRKLIQSYILNLSNFGIIDFKYEIRTSVLDSFVNHVHRMRGSGFYNN